MADTKAAKTKQRPPHVTIPPPMTTEQREATTCKRKFGRVFEDRSPSPRSSLTTPSSPVPPPYSPITPPTGLSVSSLASDSDGGEQDVGGNQNLLVPCPNCDLYGYPCMNCLWRDCPACKSAYFSCAQCLRERPDHRPNPLLLNVK